MRKAIKLAKALMFIFLMLLMATHVLALEIPVSQTEQTINGQQTIIKVFEVSPTVDPETLIETNLTQNGYNYTMTSIVKDVQNKAIEKEITQEESVTLSASKEDTARVEALKSLPPFLDYDEDGFEGKLYPLVNTLELTETGRSSHNGSSKVTKTYTVDYNDESLIPSTVTEGGKTYSRSSIIWSDGQYMDDSAIPANYIATAIFSKPYSYTTVDGYEAKLTYTGIVEKVQEDNVVYTLTYIGTPVENTSDGKSGRGEVALGIIAGIGLGVLGCLGKFYLKKK